ncbi:hypothetical protein ASG85_36485 [Paenibacillus sp. Soil724D2]|nr:hypothetical protein ASG85_36485 [Paenibacillus sp. Soil724D2]
MKVIVPASPTTGVVPLVLTLLNGQTASTNFTYDNGPVLPAPTITSMSPNSGTVGSLIYVNGANYSSASKVYVNGVQATTVYLSATRVKFYVPTGAGAVNITVVNADGQISNVFSFTIL